MELEKLGPEEFKEYLAKCSKQELDAGYNRIAAIFGDLNYRAELMKADIQGFKARLDIINHHAKAKLETAKEEPKLEVAPEAAT